MEELDRFLLYKVFIHIYVIYMMSLLAETKQKNQNK